MFDIGGGELLLIILAVIILFGPKKLPEIMKMLGKGVSKAKQAQAEFKNQIYEIEKEVEKPFEDIKDEIKK